MVYYCIIYVVFCNYCNIYYIYIIHIYEYMVTIGSKEKNRELEIKIFFLQLIEYA